MIIGGLHENNTTAELYDIKKDEFTEISTGFRWVSSHRDDDLFMTDDGEIVIRTNCFMDKEEYSIGSYSGSIILGSGYPVQYVVIFNPDDNSFTEVNFNKSSKEKIDDHYSVAVTPNGKIIAAGGNYVIKTPLKEGKATEEIRRRNSHFTKYNWRRDASVDKLIFYDIQIGKRQYSYGETIPSLTDANIFVLNDNEIIVVYQGLLGQKFEHRYNIIKF